MMHVLKPRFVNVFVLLILTIACSSTGPVEKVSSRAIDRSFTLPSGVASWSTVMLSAAVSGPTGSDSFTTIPLPIFWEQSISDDLTLEWSPLPLGIRYQLSKSENQMWGLGVNSGLAYNNGLVLKPLVNLVSRTKTADNMAWQVVGSAELALINSDGFSFGIDAGPMFQLSDEFALSPSVGLNVTEISIYSFNSDLTADVEKLTQWSVPLALALDWHFADQWAFGSRFVHTGLGVDTKKDFKVTLLSLKLSHYW